MRIALILACVVGAVFSASLIAVGSQYVWIPDAFTRDVHVVAAIPLDDETSVCVWQFWGGDFYSTFFSVYRTPDEPMVSFLLNPDGPKCWSITLNTDSDKVYASGWGIPMFAYSRSTKLGYVQDDDDPYSIEPLALEREYSRKEEEARRIVAERLQEEQ